MASLNSNTRTNASSVKEIFDTDISDDAMHSHINVAATMVDDIAATDSSVSDERLTLIERYLAAHVAATQDPRVSDESVGDASFTYKGSSDTTDYMATAASLDPTGILAGGATQVDITVLESRPNSR